MMFYTVEYIELRHYRRIELNPRLSNQENGCENTNSEHWIFCFGENGKMLFGIDNVSPTVIPILPKVCGM